MGNTILLALAPIFFILALGYFAGRFKVVDNHHVEGLNVVTMSFALPASLFAATASASRSEMLGQVPLFVISAAVMLIVFLAWYLFQILFFKADKADASLQALTIAFPNLAGVGLPIVADILGASGTVPLAVVLASGSIIISPLSLILVELSFRSTSATHEPAAVQISRALWHALSKPIVLAPAVGILFSLSGLATGPIVDSCLRLLGQAAPAVALFLTGVVLSSQAFEMNWKVTCATVLANIVRPLLTAAIVFLIPMSPETAKVAILLAAVPSGFFGILFAVSYRLDSRTTGSMVIASTVFSIVTMAIAIAVLFPK